MVYDDVVKPAKTGVTNAKHGGGVILTPGIVSNQSIDAGVSVPVSKDEPRLANRFDDQEYYGNSLSGSVTFLNNGVWKAPHGLTTQVTIEAWGQGGYGETANSGDGGHGAGGGGYAQTLLTVVGGRVYNISVNNGLVDGDGGDTSFDYLGTVYCLAEGGKSGINGGAGGGTTNIGTALTSGGGAGAEANGFGGGGGGAGASALTTGGSANLNDGGMGENGGGNGGNGGPMIGQPAGPGQPGESPGGGGGGGSYDLLGGGAYYSGAAGGLGKLIITW